MSGFRIRIIDPSGQQMEYPLQGEMLIGSSEHNHITIQDSSVSEQHLVIGTDGNQCWYREDDSADATYVNGQPGREGWLHGGEEIIIGQSRVYVVAPEIELPPEIAMPSELAGMDFQQYDQGPDLEAAGAFLDAGYSAAPTNEGPRPKKPSEGIWNVVSFGLYGVGVAVLVFGFLLFSKQFLSNPAVVEQRTNAIANALQLTLKGDQLMRKSQWQLAATALQSAGKQTPKTSPLREIVSTLSTKANNEWTSLSAFRKAKAMYTNEGRGGDALTLLRTIPKDRQISPEAQRLYTKIYNANIAKLVSDTRKYLASKNIPSAKKSLVELMSYNAKHPLARGFQEQLEKLIAATPEGRRQLALARAKLKRGFDLFRSGNQSGALAFFQKEEKTANLLLKQEIKRHIRSIQSFNTVLSKGRSAYSRGNYSQAISLLSRARRMDISLGGGNGAKYKSRLAMSYYKQGNRAYSSKKYAKAMSLFKRSNSVQKNGRATGGINRIKRKARALLKQAKLLRGIDNGEARRLTRLARRLLR